MSPPMRAWEDDEGRPRYQVKQVPENGAHEGCQRQRLAALDHLGVDDAAADRVGHLGADEGSGQVEHGGHEHRGPGRKHLGRDDRRDGVGRIVGAVGEVEHQCHHDDYDQKD